MTSPQPGSLYAARFFSADRQDGSRRSAEVVIPWLLRMVPARSVADAGCGTGTWLSVCREQGVADVLGLDGPWVPRGRLAIPAECFRETDLRRPFAVERRFDLALSLEVGEHLPAECAEGFIDSLTKLAPLVVFSAAVPGQGGTGHINEQWPAFWERLFAQCGFQALDCLRDKFWDDDTIDPWYVQNTLLYVEASAAEQYPALAGAPRGPPCAGARWCIHGSSQGVWRNCQTRGTTPCGRFSERPHTWRGVPSPHGCAGLPEPSEGPASV